MSERFKELVLKTSDTERYRGFESHSLRHFKYAGVVHRLVRQPSKLDRWVRFPSPAPFLLILGCRQAVRHQTLTLAFVGSNPAIPASSTSESSLSVENHSVTPAVQFEMLEIHPVFLRFQIFIRSNSPGSPRDILLSRFHLTR